MDRMFLKPEALKIIDNGIIEALQVSDCWAPFRNKIVFLAKENGNDRVTSSHENTLRIKVPSVGNQRSSVYSPNKGPVMRNVDVLFGC